MGEPLWNWEPVAFFAWMVLSLLGAGLIATIKANGFTDWLRWYGGLFLVGMGTGIVVVAMVMTYRNVAAALEAVSAWALG